MELHSRDQRDLDKGARVFNWVRIISKCIGVWPLEPNYYLFNICFVYFTYIMITELINLFYCLPNLKRVINNLTESLAFTHMYVRTLMLRVHIKKLGEIISECLKDYHVSAFRNSDEVQEFLMYVKKGKFFVKAAGIFVISTAASWYIRPITSPSPPQNNETSFTYVLPYKFHVFYKISDYRTYVLTYLSHSPFVVISGVGAVTSAWLLIILSFHVTGKLSVLASRIHALKYKGVRFRSDLNEIISEHSRLLAMGKGIKSSYAIALLIYFINGTILLTIIGYQILVTLISGVSHNLMPYFVFILTVYLVISIFCILSEHLLAQCNNVRDAFWTCGWYDHPNCMKDIAFCINRGQKPLGLTAGNFLTFSNSTLTDVTKTAMGYLSILRNFLLSE